MALEFFINSVAICFSDKISTRKDRERGKILKIKCKKLKKMVQKAIFSFRFHYNSHDSLMIVTLWHIMKNSETLIFLRSKK